MSGDLVEVELDDELDPVPSRPPRGPRRPWTTRRWSRLAAALAVLLATGVALDAAEARSLLAPREGLATDLRVPRHEAWRADGTWVGAVGDLAVVEGGDRSQVQGLRLADGTPAWGVSGVIGCTLVDLDESVLRSRSALRPGRSRIVCQPDDAAGVGSGVVLVDPVDGRVLLREPGTDEDAVSWATAREVLVVLASGARPRVRVLSLEDGRALWDAALDVDPQTTGWMVAGDRLVLGEDGAAFDLRSGERLDGRTAESTARADLPGGAAVTLRWSGAGSDVRSVVSDAVGRELWSVAGYPLLPALLVDGGTVPVVTVGGALEARDVRSGAVLWSRAVEGPSLAQVGGVLVLLSYDIGRLSGADIEGVAGGTTALVGLDLATGDELWDLRAGASDTMGTPGVVTDGTRFAVADPTGDGVEVRDLRTGEVATRWPGDVGVAAALVTLPRGRVAALADDGVRVLGP